MEREILEGVVRHAAREGRVEKIIELAEASATEPGENFTSTVLRMRAKVLLESGRVINKTYILKRTTPFGGHGHLFHAETKIYINVLKQMSYLMDEYGDTEEPLWCQLIHHEPYTSMLLEDLQGKGYKLVNRRIGLDLVHGIQAIRALGKFHALAKVLEERGIISMKDYKPYHGMDMNVVRAWTYPAVQNLIRGIRNWGPEWNDVAAKLDLSVEEFFENVCKPLEVEKSDFKVLNHGDCWSNNILFKYDWRLNPVSVRFIDFQYPNYSSPLIDVSHFLYISMQPSVRRHSYNKLIENYHESLISNLTKYDYEGPRPSIDDVFRVMDRISCFWMYIYASWYPLITEEPKETPDLSIIVKTGGKEGYRAEIYEEGGVKEKLAPDLLDLAQKTLCFMSITPVRCMQ
ncbi:unnamed protein product [Nezara viridula]|uniref:CHK kinase-like domain-containing protein n=1 Tax=Nezara viridula TaxID=85310 RepID=A0A9P0HGT2_NEZVI|nr:unnamed protein product [Nezara viridula]